MTTTTTIAQLLTEARERSAMLLMGRPADINIAAAEAVIAQAQAATPAQREQVARGMLRSAWGGKLNKDTSLATVIYAVERFAL